MALALSLAAAGGLCVAASTNVNLVAHERGAQVYVAAQVGWLLLTTAVADSGGGGGPSAAASSPSLSLPPPATAPATATSTAATGRTFPLPAPPPQPASSMGAGGVASTTPPARPAARPRGVLAVQAAAAVAAVAAIGGFAAYFVLYSRSLPPPSPGVPPPPPPPPGTYVRLGVAFDVFSAAEYVLVGAVSAHAAATAVLLRGDALEVRCPASCRGLRVAPPQPGGGGGASL